MILYVWTMTNTKIEKVALIDYATSIIWVTRYYNAGEFELYVRATPELLNLFASATMITRDDDKRVMIPDRVRLTTSFENGDYLIIAGKSAEGLLDLRIITRMTTFHGNVEWIIRSIVYDNCINPSPNYRVIPNLVLGDQIGGTEVIDKQITGKTILSAIANMCQAYDLGFKIEWINGQFVFTLYRGNDHATGRLPHVVFSTEYENLGNTDFVYDKSQCFTSVYVAGEGEGYDRKIVNVNDNSYGFNIRENWYDAQTMSTKDDGSVIPDATYTEMLKQEGREFLDDHKPSYSFAGEVLNSGTFTYGVDYNLGDKVVVQNEYGLTGTSVITEVSEVEDDQGYRVYPTLSEWRVD